MNQTDLNQLESILKIVAIISAAGFFGWKIIAGWLIVNLEIEIQTDRRKMDEQNDWLSINLLLKKGNTDALWLKDIVVRLYTPDGVQIFDNITFDEFQSLDIVKEKIRWSPPAKDRRKYTIAPGEVFRFGTIRSVKSNNPLIIEAAVFGKRAFWPKGFQWRSSVTSLPN